MNFHPERRYLNLSKEFKGMSDISDYAPSTKVNPTGMLIPLGQKGLITKYLAF